MSKMQHSPAQSTDFLRALQHSLPVVKQHGRRGIEHIHQCVADNQVGFLHIKPDRALRVAGEGHNTRVNPVVCETIPLLQQHFRRKNPHTAAGELPEGRRQDNLAQKRLGGEGLIGVGRDQIEIPPTHPNGNPQRL